MTAFLGAVRMQLSYAWRTPDAVQVWVTAPLLTIVLLGITESAGRRDLAGYALVAPTLMSLWTAALLTAGELITQERDLGTLESLVAAPPPLALVIAGRLCATVLLGALSFAEAWLVAGLLFGRWLTVPHPTVAAACLLATVVAMAGTASILSPLFTVLPSARIIQNTLSYPFYVLGGVLVPVEFLPGWVRPASRLVFLSWSADLLRDSLSAPPVRDAVARLAVVLVLGLAAYAVGVWLLHRALARVRRLGTLARS